MDLRFAICDLRLRGRGASRSIANCKSQIANASGFTLVEVLVSLVLIAVLIPVIMHGISLSTNAASMSVKRTQAAALCSSKVHELIATGQVQSGSQSGDFADEFPGYQWTATVQPWIQPGISQQDLASQNQTLDQMDVTVTWRGRGGQESVTLSTLVYSNAPLGPGANPVTNAETKKGPSNGNVSGG